MPRLLRYKTTLPDPQVSSTCSDWVGSFTHRFQQILHEHNTEQSFSQPGKPHDNAVAESFFASLKKEELYRKDHPSDRAFQASIASYIEFYNTKRPHRTLKNLTPCQMEEQSAENIK